VTPWPVQSAKSVADRFNLIETDFDADGVAVKYEQDHIGNDCYRVILKSGIIATVSSAHLVEEKKIQLLRFYPINQHEHDNAF
jgi:hypothetical protein